MIRPVPYIDPTRPAARRKPLKAWSHMQKLIADKEDTSQVFHIIEALNGNSARKDFDRFMETNAGQTLLEKRDDLPSLLDNHEPLQKLPEGTVGRAYIKFMQSEGLSAAGLVAESEKREDRKVFDDDLLWFANRLRDTHDLHHVLTGYGRDALGEAALLGYTHSQHGGMGVSFIAFMAGRQIRKYAPRGINVPAVIKEGRKHGKVAQRIVEQDIQALLAEPIDEARKRLNIGKPVLYKQALIAMVEAGIKPDLVAA